MPSAPQQPAPSPQQEEDIDAPPAAGATTWIVGGVLVLLLLGAAGVYWYGSQLEADPSPNYTGVPAGQAAEAAPGWTQHVDSEVRVAFDMPGEWPFATEINPVADTPQQITEHLEQVGMWLGGTVAEPPFVLASVTVGTDARVYTAESQVSSFVEGIQGSLTSTAVDGDHSFTTANGLDGHWVDLTSQESEFMLDGVAVAIVNGKNTWILALWSYDGTADSALIEQIVETVRIDKG